VLAIIVHPEHLNLHYQKDEWDRNFWQYDLIEVPINSQYIPSTSSSNPIENITPTNKYVFAYHSDC
jgi:hypothetical protein